MKSKKIQSVLLGLVFALSALFMTVAAGCDFSDGDSSGSASAGGDSSGSDSSGGGQTVAVSEVSLDETALALEIGESYTLTVTVKPADATDRDVEWSTDDAAVATVSGGRVTAVGEGQAVITAEAGGKSATCTVTVSQPAVDVVDVILFTVQSNMVGRETSPYSVSIPADYAYEYKYNTDSLTALRNPVGEKLKAAEPSSGSSIVPQFCADYVAKTGRKVVAVHVARGGQEIAKFAPGQTLYNDIVTKFTACLDYLEEAGTFEIGRTFYVMYQGESDSRNSNTMATTSKEQYMKTYMQFHNGLQAAFDFEFGAIIYTGRNTYESLAGVKTVNAAQNQLALDNEDIIVCDKAPANYYLFHTDYMLSDNVHLNAAGLRKVGSDSCRAVLDYMGLGDPEKAGVDPATYLAEPIYEVAPASGAYEWNFDEGDMSEASGRFTATKVGEGEAVFKDGKYTHAADGSSVYWELSAPLLLSKDQNWTMEWKGKSGSPMNGHAAVLLTNGANVFVTFQETNGIYLRNNDARAQFKDVVGEIYTEHVWKLSYDSAAGQVELFMDGVSKGKLAWNSDLTFTHLFGATSTLGGASDNSDNNYSFVGELDYLKIAAEDEAEPPAPAADGYEWNFDEGDMSEANGLLTATKVGDGSAVFTDGKYTHAADGSSVYWELSAPVKLSKDRNWSIEWKGKSGSPMNGHAAVLLTNGANVFVTFQETNGIYLRNNDARAQFKDVVGEIYTEHVWKLSYDSASHQVELFMDGVSKGKLAWNADLTFTHLFGATSTLGGAPDNNYSFVGELDYLKIALGA